MSATVTQIGAAIGAALANVTPKVRYAEFLKDGFTPPVGLVAVDEVGFHTSFGSSIAEHTLIVLIVLARSSDRAAIASMEGLMSNTGAGSIRAALEADVTLGGVVQSLIVTKAGKPVGLPVGASGAVYLSIPFDVTVWG